MQYRTIVGFEKPQLFNTFQEAFVDFFSRMKLLFSRQKVSGVELVALYYIECILNSDGGEQKFQIDIYGAMTMARALGLLAEKSDQLLCPVESSEENELAAQVICFELVVRAYDQQLREKVEKEALAMVSRLAVRQSGNVVTRKFELFINGIKVGEFDDYSEAFKVFSEQVSSAKSTVDGSYIGHTTDDGRYRVYCKLDYVLASDLAEVLTEMGGIMDRDEFDERFFWSYANSFIDY